MLTTPLLSAEDILSLRKAAEKALIVVVGFNFLDKANVTKRQTIKESKKLTKELQQKMLALSESLDSSLKGEFGEQARTILKEQTSKITI